MDANISAAAKQFAECAGTNRVVSAHRLYHADCDTALSLFAKVRALGSPCFMLESAEGGEKWARYTVFGIGKLIELEGLKDRAVLRFRGGHEERLAPGFETVRTVLQTISPTDSGDGTRFTGGFFGYVAYDAVRYFESIPNRHGEHKGRLYRWVVPELLFILDNFRQTLRVVAFGCARQVTAESANTAAKDLVHQLDLVDECLANDSEGLSRCVPYPLEAPRALGELVSNCRREDFMASVEKAKEYIRAGDAFQIVISQRFSAAASDEELLSIYRRLRTQNPSPYLFFFEFEDESLIGASPEVMVRLTDGVAELRPIAGTAPRGKSEAHDLQLEESLLADPKERAEHVMLVDLGRNDLGRVCDTGSIEIPEFMVIERYSKVMHIVSHVRGALSPGKDWLDVLAATFPAGTLTGAPKIRAMEIVDELEPDHRELYGGAVGHIGFDGNMDMCITIRTVHARNGRLAVQVGAGIVADSDPAREFDETVNKARAMLLAIGVDAPDLSNGTSA